MDSKEKVALPLPKLETGEANDVCFLHYLNPSQFYVYLRRQVDTHAKMQKQLQEAMRGSSSSNVSQPYQPVAVQDHHRIWHRAVLIAVGRVYFVDTGEEGDVEHLRPLPLAFLRPAAFAIPCRLYQIRSLDPLHPFTWKEDDRVHEEWRSLMGTSVQCRVCRVEDGVCYDVDVDLPSECSTVSVIYALDRRRSKYLGRNHFAHIGDLAKHLLKKQLVARHTMRSVQTNENQFHFGRLSPTRSTICTFPPQDGNYVISQVHSALEFYGHSQLRERELDEVHKRLESLFNTNQDQSLSVHFLAEGVPCVVQHGEKYHRVVIKHRESETRVLVKLVDRGDEIIVDTSELLQLESNYCSIPTFAQPFRLHGFDESQSNAQTTRKLKRLLLNQRVHLTQHLPAINGFYPVEVRLPDNQSLLEALLSAEKVISPPIRDLPAPQKLLTASVNRSQPGRFTPAGSVRNGSSNHQENVPPRCTSGDASLTFVVSHIETLTDFFIQLLSKGTELSKLTESLQTACHLAPEVSLSSLKIDQACLAKSVDQCWYRAEVLSTGITKIKVRFVDFGDTLDVEKKHLRLLEKKFCGPAPYAYRCSLKDEIPGTMKIGELTEACAGKEFHGRLISKSSDQQRFVLQSDDFQGLFRPPAPKRLPCELVFIDFDQQQFFLQENPPLMEEIRSQVEKEFQSNASPTEVREETLVLSMFDDVPYRARIQSIVDETHVQVCFIDYGNSSTCEKSALKSCSEKLKSYPPQGRACRSSTMDLEQLEEYLDSDGLEVCRMEGNEVLLYLHGQCLQADEHSTTGTTVKEQDPPTNKRNNDQILSPPSVSVNVKRQKSESDVEVYHQATLTHLDPQRPLVYLQLLPHSESLLERINTLIATIVEKNEHRSNYQIGQAVIAQFSEDNNHYRARIQSFSADLKCYTVYFIDYGNTDEQVKEEQLFAYSKELEEIEGQARPMHLEKMNRRLREKLNDLVEFRYLNEEQSLIELRIDEEEVQTFTANVSGTDKDSFYVHLLPEADSLICEMSELIDQHPKEHGTSWSTNDLCIVFDRDEDQYFRGRILTEQFDVQCIDYGKILSGLSVDDLYVLHEGEVLRRSPLARQCRLFGVNEENQIQAIREVIEQIDPNELVTITVQSKDDDDGCLRVMLFRENHDIVNDQFQGEKDSCPPSTSSDSAIAADGDHSTSSNPGPSPIGTPQAESTHQYGDTTNATMNNQTIDFGENDPSTSTTLIDEP